MNRDRPEKIDQDCNACDSAIEVGSAWSRCSNRDCITRNTDAINEKVYDELPSVSTDATDSQLADYWRSRALLAEDDGPSQDEIDAEVETEFEEYLTAQSDTSMESHTSSVYALLPFSSYNGWGAVKEAVE